ncbi:hypothetical protein N7509_013400 [Penicillium cosmopolitanum]|uniref:3-beta hydroxysteroid dehydrogenase/isomerase domain-containing protein n=1 Tax=Penicillium cosmopolitanum TaxID=1131564 RepID=A0A9W9SF88_9EURO|nr:uncharacterized protein N7509_013400 [Penicillium cosmopolitanum]KAJ5376514.1 hypothetical protein N7509_013400 [Penicillium cosmopolitanum]
MPGPNVTMPKGSLVLVTGANSYLASHVILQFLERGYKVRGTVRDIEKTSWLVEDLFKTASENGSFELVRVPNFIASNAFDEAVKGVSAVIHVATLGLDPNPNNVLPQIVVATHSILESASKEPSVKEFVYTSSVAAMVIPSMEQVHLTFDSWNDAVVELAWAPPPYKPSRAYIVYAAGKTIAEKALWEYVEKRAPHFNVNSITPASIMGECLSKSHAELPQMFVKALYDGDLIALQQLLTTPGTIHTDVKDTALLHVAAALDPEIKNERLFSWGESCTWNEILALMRAVAPGRKFVDDLPGERLKLTADDRKSLDLLKRWTGREGWTPLKETITDNMTNIMKWFP